MWFGVLPSQNSLQLWVIPVFQYPESLIMDNRWPRIDETMPWKQRWIMWFWIIPREIFGVGNIILLSYWFKQTTFQFKLQLSKTKLKETRLHNSTHNSTEYKGRFLFLGLPYNSETEQWIWYPRNMLLSLSKIDIQNCVCPLDFSHPSIQPMPSDQHGRELY